ncbi:hypothetical protein TSAR_005635 [Trichomalopsis sarcophagae]|uniref:SEA domain-containing protein n=1 Tax=Trichomalopsis sarcophagae TaxID=543379 RepID=A0A232F3D6_9HYME|nr:hypothetical protein TSAR_005635 [Trichomalopsis sarcophagae]
MILAGFLLLLAHHLVIVRTMEDTGVQESSDAYLRNVVSELQFLNGIVSSPASDSEPEEIVLPSSTPPSRLDYQVANIPQTYRLPLPPPPSPQVTSKSVPSYSLDQHHQVERAPSRNPMLLGFTPAELAAMYKKAIERGAAVKYQSLVNTINHHEPKIFGAPFELAEEARPHPIAHQEPQYAYYFYPLQSFRHELTDPHGYHTVPNYKYDSAPAENTKKETSSMNPILVGISSFLGMALFFMLSLFFYPRFVHYMHFPFVTTSRGFNNELTNLTHFVTEAIDHYNSHAKMSQEAVQDPIRCLRQSDARSPIINIAHTIE